jgi:hypothetical protein
MNAAPGDSDITITGISWRGQIWVGRRMRARLAVGCTGGEEEEDNT